MTLTSMVCLARLGVFCLSLGYCELSTLTSLPSASATTYTVTDPAAINVCAYLPAGCLSGEASITHACCLCLPHQVATAQSVQLFRTPQALPDVARQPTMAARTIGAIVHPPRAPRHSSDDNKPCCARRLDARWQPYCPTRVHSHLQTASGTPTTSWQAAALGRPARAHYDILNLGPS